MIKNITIGILTIVCTILGIHNYIYQKRTEVIPLSSNQKSDPVPTFTRKGTHLSLKNVYFRFKKNVILDLPDLTGELVPKGNSSIVNFDDVNSFSIHVKNGIAYADSEVLKVLFKDYVFNYEDSPVKLESIQFPDQKLGENLISMKGELKFIYWLGFELKGKIGLDPNKNTIVIATEEIKAVGTSYAKNLLATIGLNLQKLIPIPAGRGVEIINNQIIVHPFVVFPPPKLSGIFEEISVKNGKLFLKLSSPEQIQFPPLPEPNAKNYLFLYKGELKFGKLLMVDSRLQMIDKDPSDSFDFYVEEYFQTLSNGGSAIILPDKSVKVIMPDYSDSIR
jgi:hypothetical protein